MNTLKTVYPDDGPLRVSFPGNMSKVAQEQYSNNYDAQIARLRELLCSFLGELNSRDDFIVLVVEHTRIKDEELVNELGLDLPEIMQIWEARPISMFGCLHPTCRTPISVRNRTHLLRLLRLDWNFGFRVGAGDPVEFKTLCEMLCQSCAQEQRDCLDEQRRTQQLAIRARHSELRTMARDNYGQYLGTREMRAMKSRVRIRAGNRCQLCGETDQPLEVHHNDYSRLGAELLEDLVLLCKDCHRRHHGIQPEEAA